MWLSGKRIPLSMQETQETQVPSLGWENPLEEGMAIHSSILAWNSHGQRNLEGYSSWVGKRVGQDLATEHTHMLKCITP